MPVLQPPPRRAAVKAVPGQRSSTPTRINRRNGRRSTGRRSAAITRQGAPMIRSTMQRVPLSLNQILERAGRLFPGSEIVSRLPDKSLTRHRFADFYTRARRLASGLKALGLEKGDRVATLSWNHYAHLEAYFGIPAAGGVMHTLNLRLAPAEIAWIANHAQDRFLIVDDVLLPLLEQFREQVTFEKIIVVPLTRARVNTPFLDYEAFL